MQELSKVDRKKKESNGKEENGQKMNYFEEYRKAHDEMKDDVELGMLLQALQTAQDMVTNIRAPYLLRLTAAEAGIKETVLDQQRTMVLHGVEAIFTKPRKSTSWRIIAMTFDPSDELIEEHSKVGHPSVRIKAQEIQQEDEAPF
jgi:hypothetical protein